MPTATINGARIYYEENGGGDEAIVFAHGLLWSCRMFDKQVAALKDRYRCITFDFRGQGRSEVTAGGYDMDTLAADTAGLIRQLGAAPCHFLGLSMGGFVGLRLAVRMPELLRSLILFDTSAGPEPPKNKPKYNILRLTARVFGFRPVAGRVMPIMFGRKFLGDPNRSREKKLWRERLIANDRAGISRAARGTIGREGVLHLIPRIAVPTLIAVGDQDTATVPERSREMHRLIPGSRLVMIPGAGHTSTVEEPQAVNEAISGFLSDIAEGQSKESVSKEGTGRSEE